MKTKLWMILALAATSLTAFAQVGGDAEKKNQPEVSLTPEGIVSISSKGKDVRDVLTDLFNQSKKNFVVEGVPRTELFLALSNIEFEESLQIICRVANLNYELQNGIYYIYKIGAVRNSMPGVNNATTPQKQVGRLSDAVLKKKFTTRFNKTDFKEVVKAISKQTDVSLEIDASVPSRMVDAFLIDTTLKQGLDMLTNALGLEYKFTENMSILIFKANPNRINVLDKS